MSIEEDNQDLFIIIWLGDESDTSKPKVQFNNEFTNVDELKIYLIDKINCSVIVILSNKISVDILSPTDFPQICAIYNEKLICLYCLPTMKSSVDKYIRKEEEKQSCPSYVLSLLLKYWFLIGLVVVIFLAYLFPDVGKTGGYIRSEWSIKWGCVVLIFFLSGLSVRTKQLGKEFLHIRLHAFIQTYSLLFIPFTIYAFGLLLTKFSINKALIVGLVIMGSTATTVSSNVIMTKNAMGNEYAALLNAILGNIIGVFLSPALIFYFTKNPIFSLSSNRNSTGKQLDYKHVIKELSLAVLIPFSLGQIIHSLWTKQVIYIRNKFYFSELNNLALLALIWSVFCSTFANGLFETINKKDLFILIIIDAGIYFTFSLIILTIARLPLQYWQFSKEDTIAIMFCGPMKSLSMGISLINVFYENENEEMTGLLLLPFIIYHVQQLIFGAFQVEFLKNWVQKESKNGKSTQNDHQNIRTSHEDDLQLDKAENINLNC